MTDKSASQQIDGIIGNSDDWRGEKLAQLRTCILRADPRIVEEVKWKKPSRPEGVPVWSYNGNVIIADVLKNAVRLTFPKGAHIKDTDKLFNARMDSKTARAIDFYKDSRVDEVIIVTVTRDAVALNED